jgi:hypothetical protein
VDKVGGHQVKICERTSDSARSTHGSVETFRRPHRVELDPYNFGISYINPCVKSSGTECPGQLWSGWGFVPDRVAKVTFQTADGTTTPAELRDGVWVWRRVEPALGFHDLPSLIVRVYDSQERLLLEHDVNEQPAVPGECKGASGGC